MAYQPKSYRKFLAGTVTAAVVASAVAPAASAAFTDVPATDTHAENIAKAVEAGFIKGYEDGSFKPYQTITRGQVAKILANVFGEGVDTSKTEPFADVTANHADKELYEKSLIVKELGIFGGSNGKLDPAKPITRQQMAKVLVEAFDLTDNGEKVNLTDLDTAFEDFRSYITILAQNKVTTVTKFNPLGNVTRGQFATFVMNAVKATEVAEPAIESVSAINKTTVEVKFNTELDSVKAENFTIEGATVTAATLSKDKKSVTLTVSNLKYSTKYTLEAKGIEVAGEPTDFGKVEFKTVSVADLWTLAIETKDATLKADGADNTEVTFKLLNANGEVDKNADNIVLDLNTTYGTLAQKRVTVQDGTATVLLTSEFSNTSVTAKIDAQIIEASGDYKELIGQVVGTKEILFTTTDVENVNTVTIVSAEANQADRATLFFDKNVTIKHFVKTNTKGELLFAIDNKGEYTADEVKELDAKPEQISHVLKPSAVSISQTIAPKTNYIVKGVKPVTGNPKAVEIVLDKSTPLVDNADVHVTVNTENSLGKVTKSEVDFKVTDARVPSATSVSVEGLTTLKVKYSEPISTSTLLIDGRHDGEQVSHVSQINDQLAKSSKKFVYAFGDFNPATQEDNRDLATVVLTPNYKEDFKGAIAGFFGAGKHTVQASSTTDFAFVSDKNNIGTTQNLTFTIAEDKSKPTASVTVESPEQFRVKFDKSTNLTADSFKKLFADTAKAKVQVYDADSKEYVDVKDSDQLLKASHLEFTRVSASEFVIELNTDWTQIYNTNQTTKNYYNDKYRIVIAKEQVANVANGLTNDQIVLDLNYNGSLLNTPDVTSPTINDIKRVGTLNKFNVTMSEPVKLVLNGVVQDKAETYGDQALDTQAQTQGTQASTSVQFLGTDKDGNAVTFDGVVSGYADKDTTKADKVLEAHWTTKYFAVDKDGKQTVATAAEALDGNDKLKTGYIAVTPQDIVDQGGKAEWTIVVRAIADDVGNTAASATAKFNIEKSKATDTPFFIDTLKDKDGKFAGYKVVGKDNGTNEDTIEITFSEGVQWTGISDATNPAQYTLNGKTLPVGTKITVEDDATATHATSAGYEKVKITLPDGTLNVGSDVSNVITVNKNLVSYDGSVITGATEVTFKVAADAVVTTGVKSVSKVDNAGKDKVEEKAAVYSFSISGTATAAGAITLKNVATADVTVNIADKDNAAAIAAAIKTELEKAAGATYDVAVDGEKVTLTAKAAGPIANAPTVEVATAGVNSSVVSEDTKGVTADPGTKAKFTVEITQGATKAGKLVVTVPSLAGVEVDVAAGATPSEVAAEIAKKTFLGYTVKATGNVLTFEADAVGAKTGGVTIADKAN